MTNSVSSFREKLENNSKQKKKGTEQRTKESKNLVSIVKVQT
jgi:hypothetical protein